MKKKEREAPVSPGKNNTTNTLAPLDGGLGGLGGQDEAGDELEQGKSDEGAWDELANKYEQLEKQVQEHLDDQNNAGIREPPAVRAPTSMSKEEWDRHQVTHTHHTHRAADTAWQLEQCDRDIQR